MSSSNPEQPPYPASEPSSPEFTFVPTQQHVQQHGQQQVTKPTLHQESAPPFVVPQFNIQKVQTTTFPPVKQDVGSSPPKHNHQPLSSPYFSNQLDNSSRSRPNSLSSSSYMDHRRLTTASRNSVSSTGSAVSTVNTLYSAGDFETDIEVNQAVAYVQDQTKPQEVPSLVSVPPASNEVDAPLPSTDERKRERLKQLFKSSKAKASDTPHENIEQDFFSNCTNTLNENVYKGSTKGTLNLDYDRIMETYLFGGTIDSIFSLGSLSKIEKNNVLMNYLLNSHLETGVVNFSINRMPSHIFVTDNEKFQLLSSVLTQLDEFNEILNQYKSQLDKNKKSTKFNSKDTFKKLEYFANLQGFTIPMAQSMFGIWLLTYAKGGLDSTYNDVRIMNQFRKSARMSLILRKLVAADYFNNVLEIGDEQGNNFNNFEKIAVERFLKKDNDFALSMAIFSIGEYYQFVHSYDTAVNYWECNGHLTRDVESCNLAIWGLSDGFGGGNKVKTLEKLGHGSKRNKYNTKRRIAHLTRILSKNGGNADFGTSWVWKEKYD
ncbi:hypothetical protein CLIB1423_23S00364 [[Candida] railenensis]|uniref:Uncharacterized protein n=1 Tax=[Candida] railenensis TaxID=45579 RepID=A0A9P0QT93_9ASCO|nr:hypothetical protein CLIB1423_23S00364 [[Candida] railenensis]